MISAPSTKKVLKVKQVRSLGIRRVWDMEMPSHDNFVLENGSVAHNCKAHAKSYAVIGYACAFLKHFYPLEWWSAVLANADKNEITDKFWPHCGKYLLPPDINLSGEYFEIQGDKIRCPLSMFMGIGETARQQLLAYKPYSSFEDFVASIRKHQEKTKVIDSNGKTKLGRSALTRKVVYTLIISGAFDSILPKTEKTLLGEVEYTATGHLELYEELLSRYTKKKREKVDPVYANLTPIDRYLIRKNIFSQLTEDLTALAKVEYPELIINNRVVNHAGTEVLVVGGKDFDKLQNLNFVPAGGLDVAIICYIKGQRQFTYNNNTKEALDLSIDHDGFEYNFVKWGNHKTGKLPSSYKDTKFTGCIAIVFLSKNKEDRPFSIQEIKVLREKFTTKDVE